MCFHVKLRSVVHVRRGTMFRVIGRLLLGFFGTCERGEVCEGLIYIAGFRQAWKDFWDP